MRRIERRVRLRRASDRDARVEGVLDFVVPEGEVFAAKSRETLRPLVEAHFRLLDEEAAASKKRVSEANRINASKPRKKIEPAKIVEFIKDFASTHHGETRGAMGAAGTKFKIKDPRTIKNKIK